MQTVSRRRMLACLTMSPLILLASCGSMIRHEEQRAVSIPHIAGSALHVTGRNGSIHASVGVVDEVTVTTTLFSESKERLTAAVVRTERQADGTLKVWAEWPEPRRNSNEGASFQIVLPSANGVTLTTSNGSVRSDGLGGPATLESSNGSIVITEHRGPVEASTSNGSVRAESVHGPVSVSTSNGNVTVRTVGGEPGPLKIRTSNGSVTLDLPVAHDGVLRVSTSNGRVHYTGPASAVVRQEDHSAEFRFGPGPDVSSVTTTNGSVRVSKAEPSSM